MRRLWLDFQRPEPGRQRLGAQLLGVSLLAAGALWVQYSSLAGKVDAAQRQVSQLKRESMRQPPTATAERSASSAAPSQEGHPPEAGPSHSTASWESLFAALEAASNDSVTLLGLQPGRSEIQLIGEAKDLAASMDYVKRLQSARMFATAHLTQSDVVMENPEHPVRFTLVADWRGA